MSDRESKGNAKVKSAIEAYEEERAAAARAKVAHEKAKKAADAFTKASMIAVICGDKKTLEAAKKAERERHLLPCKI
jgi:uncharacterized MAPEG superfamily protein